MKKYLIVVPLLFFFSCNRYAPIGSNNVSFVHEAYASKTWNNYNGYQINDSLVIKWDKNNNHVKNFLRENINKYKTYKEINPNHILQYMKDAQAIKYIPIKIAPLREFGYIEMKSKEIIFYGIMGDHTLIDLSNNRVYIKKI